MYSKPVVLRSSLSCHMILFTFLPADYFFMNDFDLPFFSPLNRVIGIKEQEDGRAAGCTAD